MEGKKDMKLVNVRDEDKEDRLRWRQLTIFQYL